MSYYIIIRGPLGCGKSTLSKAISKKINGEHFSIDRILDKYHLTRDRERGYVSQKSFKKANEIACKTAIPILDAKKPIIFDGNFYWKSQVDDLVKKLDYPHTVFTLKAPLKVCIDRDSKRSKCHGEMAARVVHKKSTEFSYGITLDVTESLDKCIKKVLSHLPKSNNLQRNKI